MGEYSRHHHYIPQFYLRGFLSKEENKPKLSVIDIKTGKHFRTSPRNVGGARDFNRVDIDGFAPDIIESNFSKFETEAANAIKQLAEEKCLDNKTAFDYLLNLIALFSIRHPSVRQTMANTNSQIMKMVMKMICSSKEQYESHIERAKKDGVDIEGDVSYEKMKDFVDRGEYDILMQNQSHINMELEAIDPILNLLSQRGWSLMVAEDADIKFLTSDRPVVLAWKNPDEVVPPAFRSSPGFGLNNTYVYFPITPEIAVIGEFGMDDQVVQASNELVAHYNSIAIRFAYSQIYASSIDFSFLSNTSTILKGPDLVDHLKSNSSPSSTQGPEKL